MTTPTVIQETPITMAELKNELAKIRKRDKDLNFRANKTEEYLKNFNVLDAKKAEELYEKIVKLDIPRLKDTHMKKIVDILPKTVEDLKVVLEAYPITVTQDNMKKIVSLVANYL